MINDYSIDMMHAIGELISNRFYESKKLLVSVSIETAFLELKNINTVIGTSLLYSVFISVECLSNSSRQQLTYKHIKVSEDSGKLKGNNLVTQLISMCDSVLLWYI
jgi:hypothetical protein